MITRHERVSNSHSKGERVKIPLLPNKVGKRSKTMLMVTTVSMTIRLVRNYLSGFFKDTVIIFQLNVIFCLKHAS